MTISLISGDGKNHNLVFPEVKKVYIKRNYTYGYYSLFVGSLKVWQDTYKPSVVDYAEECYPNATIVDKTL